MLEMLPLPYEFDALEPFIDAETMKVHYNGHYQTYTTNANESLKDIPYPVKHKDLFITGNFGLRHNFGGWWNHTFFFDGLAPDKNEISTNSLLYAEYPCIEGWFYEQIDFSKLYASGYIWLFIVPGTIANSLYVGYSTDQKIAFDQTHWPLLNIDMWEHAYYLKHQNKKQEYINNIFRVINWEKVNQRLENFIKMKETKDARFEPA